MEETFFSGISSGDGDDADVGIKRWSGIPEEEGQQYSHSLVESKRKFFEKKAQSDFGC